MYRHFLKRVFDIIISFFALCVLWPVLLVVAILVRIKLGSPVLFSQERPGKDEKIFRMYKFRTMTDERDENGALLPDEVRLTSFGKFLRSASLDELPELWAIFTGKMSFVGPRPLLVQYLPLYNAEQHRRHEVRPGLTGWAQVNGRNLVNWQERFRLDVEYVDKMSLWMDIKIMFLTVKTVLVREGISSETSATMEFFRGNEEE